MTTLTVTNSVILNSGGTGGTGGGVRVGATGTGLARAVIRNTTLDRNFIGVLASATGQLSSINVVDSSITSSAGNGLNATGTNASIKVGSSFIIGNLTAATSGNVSSFGNNEIIDNNPDTPFPPSAGALH